MQTYRYAYDIRRDQADVLEITDVREKYTCIACGRELVAKIKGNKRDKHFAHKSQGKCSRETYLHILAKNVFALTFKQCQHDGRPFLLRLPRTRLCPLGHSGGKRCELGTVMWTEHDLTTIYRDILMEKRDGSFIPDLLLLDEAGSKKMYVEVKVSSPVSEAKATSGVRILELDISNEGAIQKIDTCRLEPPFVTTYNFRLDTIAKEPPAGCQYLRASLPAPAVTATQPRQVKRPKIALSPPLSIAETAPVPDFDLSSFASASSPLDLRDEISLQPLNCLWKSQDGVYHILRNERTGRYILGTDLKLWGPFGTVEDAWTTYLKETRLHLLLFEHPTGF